MKLNKKLFFILSAFGCCTLASQNVLADTTAASANTDISIQQTDNLINKLSAQTQQLEKQVSVLKRQVVQLKKQQAKQTPSPVDKHPVVRVIHSTSVNPNLGLPKDTVEPPAGKKPPVTYISGTPVVIAPYVGQHTAFNALDLVVNYTDYNEDLALLQLRRDIFNQYHKEHLAIPAGPMLMLSGQVVTQLNYLKPYTGGHQSSINLSGAELDIIPMINNWVSGLLTLTYDNTINTALPGAPRTSNSRIYVDRGFLTIGDLNRLPIYTTIGQMYVPFGHYISNMIDNSIPQDMFQTRARALLLGYQHSDNHGPYAQIYAFNGDTSTSRQNSNDINNLGANLGFKFDNHVLSSDLGVGVISNIADSLGMQNNGQSSGFAGFSNAASSEILYRQVPGVAVSYLGSIKQGRNSYNLIGEYVTAMSSFAPQNLMFDGHGAKPQAFNVELSYSFHVLSKPTAFAIGYGGSRDALALNVPEKRYIATASTSIWKDTIEEIEFRHDINYATTDTAGGTGGAFAASGLGGNLNSVLAQVGIYF